MATTFRSKMNYPNGAGTLLTTIDDNDLTIVLSPGHTITASTNFTVTIDEEIILIDSIAGDTMTVNASGRGYDSSTASGHTATAGIYNYQIVADFTNLETAVNGIENGTTTLASLTTTGAITCGGDLAVNGATSADITSTTTTASVFNATVTTLNIGGAATALNLGAATGTCTIANAIAKFNGAVGIGIATPHENMEIAENAVSGPIVYLTNLHATSLNASLRFAYGATPTLNWGVGTDYDGDGGTEFYIINASAAQVLTLEQAGGATVLGTLTLTNSTIAGTATTANVFTSPTTVNAFTGASTALNMGHASGTTTLAGAVVCSGRFRLVSVTDAGPMTATNGSEKDLVYNESDSKVYVCVVSGTPATWSALN